MDLSSVIRKGHPIAFAIFIVISLILAIIASAVVADLNHNGNQNVTHLIRDTARFMVFTGWWSVLFGVIFVRIPSAYLSAGSLRYWHWWRFLVDC